MARSGIAEDISPAMQGAPLERDISMGLGVRGYSDIDIKNLEDQVRLLAVADLAELNDSSPDVANAANNGDGIIKLQAAGDSD